MIDILLLGSVFCCKPIPDRAEQKFVYLFLTITTFRCCRHAIHILCIYLLQHFYRAIRCCVMAFCSCQVRNKKKLIFFINGEPLARFPMLLLYNFVFSLLLLIIPSSSLKVIKVPSDFNMLIIIHQHIINEISDYFFIKLIQLTKLC